MANLEKVNQCKEEGDAYFVSMEIVYSILLSRVINFSSAWLKESKFLNFLGIMWNPLGFKTTLALGYISLHLVNT